MGPVTPGAFHPRVIGPAVEEEAVVAAVAADTQP